MMNPPDQAIMMPLKTSEVVMTDLNCMYKIKKMIPSASGSTTINVFWERNWFS